MKYICTEDDKGNEEIFLFPRIVNHDCMAEMIGRIKNDTRGNWCRVKRTPTSAGFVGDDLQCHGESITLGLKSWPTKDTEILRAQFN